MKKSSLVLSILMFIAMNGVVYAGQFFGAPEPVTQEGKFALGVGYFFAEDRFELTENGAEFDLQQNQIFVQGSYSFIDGAEVFLRGGFADAEIDSIFATGDDFEDDFQPFGALGVKMVNDLSGMWSVGAYLQWSLYSSYDDRNVEIDQAWEIDLAAALQAKVSNALIYAGPFGYMHRMSDIEEDQNIGGFGGLAYNFGKNFRVDLEGQMKNDFSFGGALTYAF